MTRSTIKPILTMPTSEGGHSFVEWDFSARRWPRLEILQLTDIQYGSAYCREDKVREHVKWVLAAPWRRVVFGGDMVEAFNYLKSPGTPADQKPGSVMDQVKQAVSIYQPIAGRVLGYVSGNHERRHMALGDLTGLVAEALGGIPWAPGRQHIAIRFGAWQKRAFRISMHHGRGSAMTRGSIVNALERMALQDDCDLFLMGHLHQSNAIHIPRPVWDEQAGQVVVRDSWAAMGSSFLSHYGSYADVAGYRANKLHMPLAVLERDGEWRVLLHG